MTQTHSVTITPFRPTPRRSKTLLGLLRPARRKQKGATVVEFAVVMPAFLGMLFAIFEVGLLFFKQMLLDNALQNAARGLLVGTTQASWTPSTATAVENAFRTEICNGSFFYRNSCSDVKIQVLIGDAEINGNRNFKQPINDSTSPPTITISPSHSFSPLPATLEPVVVRVYAPTKTFIAKINGIGLTMTNGDSVLVSSTAFVVEPI
jgi:Flp pilus assembly protein TadG